LFTGVVDTSEKFITSVVVTDDNCSPVSLILAKNLSWVTTTPVSLIPAKKFITSVVVTSDPCSPVLLILAINLSSVSLSPAIIVHRRHCTDEKLKLSAVLSTSKQFIVGVVDTADKQSFAIIFTNFQKKFKH
jgi:hypothetical protein